MTTIHTFEDLIRAMDENPEWVEAMRARILTRELIEMPSTLARFAEATNRRFDILEAAIQSNSEGIQANRALIQSNSEGIEANGAAIQGIRDDMALLKAAHARNAALRQFDLIAEDMGLEATRLLADREIREIARSLRNDGTISRSDYESFRVADGVIEVEDADGELLYIALEASFSVNGRDTRRAIRNAGFMTQATGRPARAAVSGISRDDRVQEVLDSGEVYWHQLDPQLLEVE